MFKKKEKSGAMYVLAGAAMWGIFPIVTNKGTQHINPIVFAAVSTLLAGIASFVYVAASGKVKELAGRKAYSSMIMITLCVVVIPYLLFFTGTSMTSGINSSMLLMSEIIFTLIVTGLIGEKTTILKLLGAMSVFFGACCILYKKGSIQLNEGDMLIIASTITYPIGNFYTKKALNYVSPATILFVRFTLGGIIISLVALMVSPVWNLTYVITEEWGVLLFTGLFLLGIGKVIWYEGLKRLDISKAISLGSTFPLFSIIFLTFYYGEIPNAIQWAGICIMLAGIYFSLKRKSVDPSLTRYAGD